MSSSSSLSWCKSDTGVLSVFQTLQPEVLDNLFQMPDVWLVRVPTVFDSHEPVQQLDSICVALSILSDDACGEFEVLFEHAFQPGQVFNVRGRHEIISVYHTENVTFLMSEHARTSTSHSELAVAKHVGEAVLPVSCFGPLAVHRH